MNIDYDDDLDILWIQIGKREINSENVRQDFESLVTLLKNDIQQPTNMVVNIEKMPLSLFQIPSIVFNVVSFSGQHKNLIESKIKKAFLVSGKGNGQYFIQKLLEFRQSEVPVVVCSSLDEVNIDYE